MKYIINATRNVVLYYLNHVTHVPAMFDDLGQML